jgi:hypothetical protein
VEQDGRDWVEKLPGVKYIPLGRLPMALEERKEKLKKVQRTGVHTYLFSCIYTNTYTRPRRQTYAHAYTCTHANAYIVSWCATLNCCLSRLFFSPPLSLFFSASRSQTQAPLADSFTHSHTHTHTHCSHCMLFVCPCYVASWLDAETEVTRCVRTKCVYADFPRRQLLSGHANFVQ